MLKEISSWYELVNYKGEIVCIGIGMVLSHIEQLLCEYGISDKVCILADNDPAKWGTEVFYGLKIYTVVSVDELKQMSFKNPLALITCEKDKEIIEQLKDDKAFDHWNWGSYPQLNYYFKKDIKKTINLKGKESYIPSIIHYIWFGNKKIPEEQQSFIAGWKRICDNYEFVLWNEFNYDVNKCTYTREAFHAGDYARVSDYARMDILYHYGGFYMDTDVELLKSLDVLRCHRAVFAFGEWPVVNSGIICGSVPKNELIRRLRDEPRTKIPYYDTKGKPDRRTNCYYENEVLKEIGFKGNFVSQLIDEIALYSPIYFASEGNYYSSDDITDETIAIHHCAGSWKREKYG